jgi:hypothetical protein
MSGRMDFLLRALAERPLTTGEVELLMVAKFRLTRRTVLAYLERLNRDGVISQVDLRWVVGDGPIAEPL